MVAVPTIRFLLMSGGGDSSLLRSSAYVLREHGLHSDGEELVGLPGGDLSLVHRVDLEVSLCKPGEEIQLAGGVSCYSIEMVGHEPVEFLEDDQLFYSHQPFTLASADAVVHELMGDGQASPRAVLGD